MLLSGIFKAEKWLVCAGFLGFALAAVCGVGALLFGGEVEPGGNLFKAFSFNAALGVFLLSTAAIMPLSGMGRKGRFLFRWSYIVLALYSYSVETVQNIRGVNPRFVVDGSTFDYVAANIFAADALLMVFFYFYLALQFFRQRAYETQPELVVGIRYAMFSVFVAFAGGIAIAVNGGRILGAEGNLIWLHGLGFHALQALPAVAWLAVRADFPGRLRQTIIHASGIAFFLGLILIGWQTLLGRPLLEWSPLPLTAAALFFIAAAAGARALSAAWKKSGGSRDYSVNGQG